MSTVIDLLIQARRAGLTLAREHRERDEALRVRGPRSAEAIVRELLARKRDVLATVSVYNGDALRLDWRKGRILDQPQACVLCGKRTLLIEPYDSRPCHKGCAETAIRYGATPNTKEGKAA